MKKSVFLSESNFDFKGKTVLVRIDCDVDLREEGNRLVVDEDFRLRSALSTIHFLKERGVERIILLGHLDRPGGKVVEDLSLQPVADWFDKNVESCKLFNLGETLEGEIHLYLLENLRFNSGEESNDKEFVKMLASLGDVYINDAFGVSHRRHASIVGLPQLLPSFLGIRVEGEMRILSWLRKKAQRPLVFVLGGSKQDKLDYIEFLVNWADYLLVGGKLPLLFQSSHLKLVPLRPSCPPAMRSFGQVAGKQESSQAKLKVNLGLEIGKLNKEGKDITEDTVEKFKKIIRRASCLIWAGPMGVYEEERYRRGTWEVAQAISESAAFKIAGGGDTHRILSWMGIWERFDFVSVGGGAMLEFLKEGTLAGIEAIRGS